MIIRFKSVLLLKDFLACNGCFGLFSKTKKGSGTSFWCTFSAWFFHKNIPYLILYQWTKFHCHILFRQLMMSKISWIFLDSPLKQWLMGEKRGKTKIQKFEYLKNEKSLLNEIKNIFLSFWRAIIWWKIKIW